MNEEKKREKFQKIATNRTNKVLDTLRLIGNCANTSNYSYSEEDVKKIFTAIENELRIQKSKFERKERKKFSL